MIDHRDASQIDSLLLGGGANQLLIPKQGDLGQPVARTHSRCDHCSRIVPLRQDDVLWPGSGALSDVFEYVHRKKSRVGSLESRSLGVQRVWSLESGVWSLESGVRTLARLGVSGPLTSQTPRLPRLQDFLDSRLPTLQTPRLSGLQDSRLQTLDFLFGRQNVFSN